MTDELLHGLARVLLRFLSPVRAYSCLSRVASFLPPHARTADARRAGARIRGRGTCLTRALTVAARSPDAELVIGVVPRPGQLLFAHAWVEVAGEPLDASEVLGTEIARLRGGSCSIRR